MIRTRSVDPSALNSWLAETIHGTVGGKYVLRLLKEDDRADVYDQLAGYVHEAHDDARQKLRNALSQTLAPYSNPLDDPAFGYPADLHLSTLMGYFGEVLAGLLAEHKAVHGKKSWKVPAFLFRFHQVAFQKLHARRDLLQQGLQAPTVDGAEAKIPGRTGNDVLAFSVGPKGSIDSVLVCEAKCFGKHSAEKAREAHAQVSSNPRMHCPSGVPELIELLNEYDTDEANAWCERLRQWYFDKRVKVARFNLLSYAVGDAPKRPTDRKAWLDTNAADPKYTSTEPLEVIEVHLESPEELVRSIYRRS